ncbi:GatB/YqeY domain-containing protein [Jeotgalibaca arthritidis]|uniref:GatB/YqeY domain-containing protein n=1 Tax=Jeotgalibaca arthritidis TaxID=1868794 RepID=A0A6G7K7X1_9LACT|nr:GatB/YqeY domain-containing protein [Jeotgalibaca arthritidis]QII81350.1 GatB/YqeY domain-containing protein [Jeotgalibaca arthritidis]
MTIKEQINKDFIQARKDKEALKISVLRIIKSHFDSFKIDNGRDMDDKEEINYLLKEQKQTEEAIQFANEAGRDDLVQENKEKLAIISNYLPTMMTQEDIESFLTEKGVADMAMKDAMKFSMAELDGKADKKVISQVVKNLLAK